MDARIELDPQLVRCEC